MERGGERLLVREQCEGAALKEETEVADSGVGGRELAVESAVLHFSGVELSGKESEWGPPGGCLLLKDRAHVGVGGVHSEGNCGRRVVVV